MKNTNTAKIIKTEVCTNCINEHVSQPCNCGRCRIFSTCPICNGAGYREFYLRKNGTKVYKKKR